MLDGVMKPYFRASKKLPFDWDFVFLCWEKPYREATDAALMEQIIANNLGTTEFFINKAIGWSLREYSKVNAEWVRGQQRKNISCSL